MDMKSNYSDGHNLDSADRLKRLQAVSSSMICRGFFVSPVLESFCRAGFRARSALGGPVDSLFG